MYTIQTRIFINDLNKILEIMTKNGYLKDAVIKLDDTYYSSPGDISEENHTYEKTGKSIRLRVIDNKVLFVEEQSDDYKAVNNKVNHDICKTHRLFEGSITDKETAINIIRENGCTEELTKISKIRTIYTKDNSSKIFMDDFGDKVYIMEVVDHINNFDEYDITKSKQLELIGNLNINSLNILSDGYTHRKITQNIKANPIKLKISLEEELKSTIELLRKTEKISGEAYHDTGDGWHENPTYETIYNDMLVLNKRIIDIKTALKKLKK
jgi:adenylate cyclase class IV